MGRLPTHGAHLLAKRAKENRITPRLHRRIAAVARALEMDTPGAAAALFRRRVGTREEILLRLEAHAASNPDGTIDQKWLVSLWNAQRRDLEVLALLDAQRRSAPEMLVHAPCGTAYAPHEYATHDCPALRDAPPVASQPAVVAAPATAGPTEDADG